MLKNQLKTGMTVEIVDGTKYIVMLGTQHCGDVIMRDGGFITLDKYRNDLSYNTRYSDESGWDIVKVYDMPTAYSRTLSSIGKCVWTRPEKVKDVTMADVEAMFGCKVKIVK